MEFVSTAPDDHDQGEKCNPGNLGAQCAANALVVEGESENIGTDDLHGVVGDYVQSSGAGVEVGGVDLGEVVDVEPVSLLSNAFKYD